VDAGTKQRKRESFRDRERQKAGDASRRVEEKVERIKTGGILGQPVKLLVSLNGAVNPRTERPQREFISVLEPQGGGAGLKDELQKHALIVIITIKQLILNTNLALHAGRNMLNNSLMRREGKRITPTRHQL
jgi:hypothetical protein